MSHNLLHYRKNISKEYGEDAKAASAFLYGLMDEAASRGLPVDNTFESTDEGDFQSIVILEILHRTMDPILTQAGFEFVPRPAGKERDEDFWAKLIRGEQI